MTTVKLPQRSFEQTFNNLLDDFFAHSPSLIRNGANGGYNTVNVPVNIRKNETGYELEVVAPGFDKEAFQISVDRNLLTISAEHKTENDQKEDGFIRREFRQRSFKRSFTINELIDVDKIGAKFNNGILVVNLPKKVEVKEPVKQISIQ